MIEDAGLGVEHEIFQKVAPTPEPKKVTTVDPSKAREVHEQNKRIAQLSKQVEKLQRKQQKPSKQQATTPVAPPLPGYQQPVNLMDKPMTIEEKANLK